MANENERQMSAGGGQMQNVEFLRFIGMLMIMGHHLYFIGYSDSYICKNGWVWVDFYFILTGAFTYRHSTVCRIVV